MSDSFYRINRGITLNPQAGPPSNPINGDLYYDSTQGTFVQYNNGFWINLASQVDVSAATTLTSTQFTAAVVQNSLVRITGAISSNLYGLTASTASKEVVIHNASSGILTLLDEDVTEPTAANRISTPDNQAIQVGVSSSVTLLYDATQARWIVASFSPPPQGLFASGTVTAPSIAWSADADGTGTGLYRSGTNEIAFTNNGVYTAKFTAANKFLLGSTTARTAIGIDSISAFYQEESSNTISGAAALYVNNSSNNTGAVLQLAKSRGTTPGAVTIVQNNDILARMEFLGADGTTLIPAASIKVEVDSTPGINDMPGRIVFSTTADGSATSTERMRLDSTGRLGIGATPSGQQFLLVQKDNSGSLVDLKVANTSNTAGSGTRIIASVGTSPDSDGSGDPRFILNIASVIDWNMGIDNSDANKFMIGTDSTPGVDPKLTIDTSGRVGIGATAPLVKLQVTGPSTATDAGSGAIGIFHITTGTGASGDAKLEFGVNDGTSTTGYAWLQSIQASSGFRNLILNANGGNVGIGTTNPLGKLHVSGGDLRLDNDKALFIANAAGTATLGIKADTSDRLTFRAGGAWDRLVIDSTGRVGIGLTTPQKKLQIKDNSSASTTVGNSEVVRVAGGSSVINTLSEIGLTYGDSSTDVFSPAIIGYRLSSGTGNTKGDIYFATRDVTTDTAPLERMRIDSAGTMMLSQVSAGSTPPSNFNSLYFKSDGNLYKKNSAGTETNIDISSISALTFTQTATPSTPSSGTNKLYFSNISNGRLTTLNDLGDVTEVVRVDADEIHNISVVATLDTPSTDNMTIKIQQGDGNTDHGSSAPGRIGFNTGGTTGDQTSAFETKYVASVISMQVPNGATLGAIGGQKEYAYVYAINDSGTIRLGISLRLFDEGELVSTIAISGSANDRNVMYTATGVTVTNKHFRLLARIHYSASTDGSWSNSAPVTTIIKMSVLPKYNAPLFAWYKASGAFTTNGSNGWRASYDTKLWDTHNAVTPGSGSNNTTWLFTAPFSGFFTVSLNGLKTASPGTTQPLYLLTTTPGSATPDATPNHYVTQGAAANEHDVGTTEIYLPAGGTFFIDNGTNSSTNYASASETNWIAIRGRRVGE